MTELKWLIEMLMNQKMSASLKDRFIARIGEVESSLTVQPPVRTNLVQARIDQAMTVAQANPPAIAQIAQTASAQAALQDRQKAISIAASGKPEEGRTSPRKF